MHSRALDEFGARVLQEVESVASTNSAIRNIRLNFDPAWTEQHAGLWLKKNFDHDYVFVFGADDKPIYALIGTHPSSPSWFAAALPDIKPLLDFMRGRDLTSRGTVGLDGKTDAVISAHAKAVVIRNFMGRPAALAAAVVGPLKGIPVTLDKSAPILMSVEFINHEALAGIAAQLQLAHLRQLVGNESVPEGDFAYTL